MKASALVATKSITLRMIKLEAMDLKTWWLY